MNDYEKLKQYIKLSGYKIKTDIDNLIEMCFMHYNCHIEDEGKDIEKLGLIYIDGCIEFVKDSGLYTFDYYC